MFFNFIVLIFTGGYFERARKRERESSEAKCKTIKGLATIDYNNP
jgi:hypothetical protein